MFPQSYYYFYFFIIASIFIDDSLAGVHRYNPFASKEQKLNDAKTDLLKPKENFDRIARDAESIKLRIIDNNNAIKAVDDELTKQAKNTVRKKISNLIIKFFR